MVSSYLFTAERGSEGHPDQGDGRARHQGLGGAALESGADAAGVAAHPDDHVGDGPDRDHADHRLQALLLALGELLADHPQGDRRGDAEPDRDRMQQAVTQCPAAALRLVD